MKKLILTAILAFVSYAGAADLNGHQMECSFFNGITSEVTNTTYIFSKGPKGQDVAQLYNDTELGLHLYQVTGSKLNIDRAGETLAYDLSASPQVRRQFKACITPGQGGGDTRPICTLVLESCLLK